MYLRVWGLSPILFITCLLAACAPKPGVIPTVAEVIEKRSHITMHQAQIYCHKHKGHFEEWETAQNGKKEVLCILPNGYGCEPIAFVRGACGGFDDF